MSKKIKQSGSGIFVSTFLLVCVATFAYLANNYKSEEKTSIAKTETKENLPTKQEQTIADSTTETKINVPHKVSQFVKTYCIDCHNEDKDKGDRRLDNLSHDFTNYDTQMAWEEVLDQLNLGEMPPEKKNVKQPSKEETKYMIEWITKTLHSIESDQLKNETVMRRLNRQEYLQTLSDILAVNVESFDPTELFPQDVIEEGFDNIGEAQVLSDYQLQRYLEAAEKFIDKATVFGKRPEIQKWEFNAKHFSGSTKIPRAQVSWSYKVGDKFVEHGHGRPVAQFPLYPKSFGRKGVPENGLYKIRVKAEAARRLTHPYKRSDFPMDLNKKIKMGLVAAYDPSALTKNNVDRRRLIEIFELVDSKPKWYETTTWLDKGSTPFVHWINGSGKTKAFIRKIGMKYHREVMDNSKRDEGTYQGKDRKKIIGKTISDVYKGPVMRVYEISYEGPILKEWPPASHQALYGKATDISEVDIEKSLTKLATKAFRRPVTKEEVAPYVAFVNSKVENGDSKESALKQGFKAILVSPKFLFIEEGNEKTLDAHKLANRLSYFLWSSSPDEKLRELAELGKLKDKSVLKSEILRMLQDSKSLNFSKRFTDSWLRLNTLGMNPPDTGKFRDYYENRLEEAMRQETLHFFNNILKNNLSSVELLDSKYTFLNDVLADHYGIKGVVGKEFRKVPLPSNSRRGGLLGQASILTLTSNGVETSPVIRGIWILENILGTPPSPPPPDVDPLEPDVRGTKTIREQLNKHRNVEACADCHRKIDPLGFALEHFDPIGSFRADYREGRKRLKIDASGQLPSGEEFKDDVDFKKILLKRKHQFIHTLTEKLLIYATGRKMTFKDKKAIDQIVENVGKKNNSLKEIVLEVALSEIFATK